MRHHDNRRIEALLSGWYDIVSGGSGYPYAYHGVHGGYAAHPYGGYQGYPAGYARLGAAPALPPAPMPPMAPPMPAAPPMHPHHAFPFPPRAALVEHPAPTQADRWILPMSTGVPILPTQSAQITGRPQAQAYQCNRFVISNSGTSGGAADWIVNDIKVGNQSQFVQSGDVPGDMFATNAIDTFVRFQTAQTAMDVVVVVTYIGLNESGVPFFGAMLGTAAV